MLGCLLLFTSNLAFIALRLLEMLVTGEQIRKSSEILNPQQIL